MPLALALTKEAADMAVGGVVDLVEEEEEDIKLLSHFCVRLADIFI